MGCFSESLEDKNAEGNMDGWGPSHEVLEMNKDATRNRPWAGGEIKAV